MAWGNGFTINQTLIQQYNLSDPSGFFEDISAVPTLVNRTILSPHVYGPNVTVRKLECEQNLQDTLHGPPLSDTLENSVFVLRSAGETRSPS